MGTEEQSVFQPVDEEDLDEEPVLLDEKSLELRDQILNAVESIFTPPSKSDGEIQLELMGQKFQLPADKWTTAAMLATLATAIVVVTYIVFVLSNPQNFEQFGNIFSSHPLDKPTATQAQGSKMQMQKLDDTKLAPLTPPCICDDD